MPMDYGITKPDWPPRPIAYAEQDPGKRTRREPNEARERQGASPKAWQSHVKR